MQSEGETLKRRPAFSANGIAVSVKKQINLTTGVVKSELSVGANRYMGHPRNRGENLRDLRDIGVL